MWLQLGVLLGMEECEGSSSRFLEQKHLLPAGEYVCVGGGVLLSQLWIKVLCRLTAVRYFVTLGEGGGGGRT